MSKPNKRRPAAAREFVVWRELERRKWAGSYVEIAESLDMLPATVRAVCIRRGWHEQIEFPESEDTRTDAYRYMTHYGAGKPGVLTRWGREE